jgi:hypothetical protein
VICSAVLAPGSPADEYSYLSRLETEVQRRRVGFSIPD